MDKANTKQLNNNNFLSHYCSNGSIIWKKLMEYIPPLLLTNLSTLLLVSVDGLIVGNFVSQNALASVNFFYPITLFFSVITVLISSGCATAISNSIGSNDQEQTNRIKNATLLLTIFISIFIAIVQIPVVYGIINFGMRELSADTLSMMRQYANGIMISMPFGFISTIGIYQLQISGKMKLLVKLAALEGITNLIFDLYFVGVMKKGIAGAGYGTATATILRCIVTVIYISRETDMYKCGGNKATARDIQNIFYCGMTEATDALMAAFKNYFFLQILFIAFGDAAGIIRGVCAFCFNLVCVLLSGILGGMRPLVGLLSGAKDTAGVEKLLRQCIWICVILVGAITIIVELFPEFFFHLHGSYNIPEGGILSLRLYSFYFILNGLDGLYQLIFINRKESGFATVLTIVAGVLLLVFAFVFAKFLPAPFVWLAYPVTMIIVLAVDILHYKLSKKNDIEKDAQLLYLCVKPDEASDAAKLLEEYVIDKGYPANMANRLSICLEEMVSYSVNKCKNVEIRKYIHQKVSPERLVELLPDDLLEKLMKALHETNPGEPIPQFPGEVLKILPKDLQELIQENVENYIIIRLEPDEASFIMIDTGRRVALNEDSESKHLVTDNYTLIKKLSKSVEYQYVLDMNYTVITI